MAPTPHPVLPTGPELNETETHKVVDLRARVDRIVADLSSPLAGHIAQAARDGFNEYLEEQVSHGGPTWWTLTTFNTHTHTRFAAIPGAEVRPLGDDSSPGGGQQRQPDRPRRFVAEASQSATGRI